MEDQAEARNDSDARKWQEAVRDVLAAGRVGAFQVDPLFLEFDVAGESAEPWVHQF